MRTSSRSIATRAGALLSAVALLAACGGSDGGTVDEGKLKAKLKTESTFKNLGSQAGGNTQIVDGVITCVAKALEKNADTGDLNDYINGKKSLDDVGAKNKNSEDTAENEAKTCAENAVKSATASPTG